MKLDIVYTNDRQVKVQHVTYITVFNNKLHYFDADEWAASIVDLKDVAVYSVYIVDLKDVAV